MNTIFGRHDSRTYGGYINENDFWTNYTHPRKNNEITIADRIISDWKFDQECRNAVINNKRKQDKKNEEI